MDAEERVVACVAKKKGKFLLIFCIISCLGTLFFYKYSCCLINFLNFLGIHTNQKLIKFDILLPVGISFYTLQAIGYLIDIYRGKINAEKNFFRYALFVSFFPQLVAGPIERSSSLLIQLREYHAFSFENLKKGILLVIYGLFLKMVIADRAAIIVDTVFSDIGEYSGFYIVAAVFFFSIQIYCDFYGYSVIARGSALLMGIHLMNNFSAPYYACSVKEFWKRWHISLSGWFRDYLYITLGGSRKGFLRKEFNLLIVFAVSGLWHGASMGFVFWGVLHALYQIIPELWRGFGKKLVSIGGAKLPNLFRQKDKDVKSQTFSVRLFRRGCTFVLVCFAWLFFRAGNFISSLDILKAMFSVNNWTILFDGSLCKLGVARNYMCVMFAAVIILFVVDYFKCCEHDVADLILQQGWIFQMLVGLVIVFAILLYGCYGDMYDVQQFIYFQF